MKEGRLSLGEASSVELIDTDGEEECLLEPSGPETFTGADGTSVRIVHPPPRTLGELLRLENYYKSLAHSFVFIQNTKGSSDNLVKTMVEIIGLEAATEFLQTHIVGLDRVLEKIRSYEALKFPKVFVVDITDTKGDINQFCESVALISPRQCGVWLRGHIRHLDPRVISLFDALFTFDMSLVEYEVLRSVISLPAGVIGRMRREADGGNRVLCFLNYERSEGMPLIEPNPFVLSQVKEGPMDITPLLPIISEATRFLFNEASQWLEVVRKRIVPEPEVDSGVAEGDTELPVLDKEQFSVLAEDLESLKSIVDQITVEMRAYRIQGLVEQLKIHYKNLTDLEKTEAEYGALVPQYIRRAIERESRSVLDKTQELQRLLSAVYQRRLQV